MDINFIYRCGQCDEVYHVPAGTVSNKDGMYNTLYATLFYERNQYTNLVSLEEIHDCKGDQSVYGVARLIGIEKVG